ncbi:MAG: hypothetical protein IPM95_11895 [Sphingobacteriales bacterium]|nr:hypothetical protein [Sphingobacteriales bacterium]
MAIPFYFVNFGNEDINKKQKSKNACRNFAAGYPAAFYLLCFRQGKKMQLPHLWGC